MKFAIMIFILYKIHITIAQFPEHTDLQKIGEIVLKKEKYNILKPTLHAVTDHFKDFMLGTHRTDVDERVFIDDSGFRHFWTGFNANKARRAGETKAYDEDDKPNPTNNTDDATVSKNDTTIDKSDVNKPTNDINDAHNATVNATSYTNKTIGLVDISKGNNTTVVRKKPKRPTRKQPERTVYRTAEDVKDIWRSGAEGKTIAKTTFFCPFFGVMTMSAFID